MLLAIGASALSAALATGLLQTVLARVHMPLLMGVWLAVYAGALAASGAFGVSIGFWAFSAVYALGFMLYFFLIAALYKSLSVAMMIDLQGRPGHAIPFDFLLRKTIEGDSFSARIAALRATEFAYQREGLLFPSARGVRIARIVRALQLALGISQGG